MSHTLYTWRSAGPEGSKWNLVKVRDQADPQFLHWGIALQRPSHFLWSKGSPLMCHCSLELVVTMLTCLSSRSHSRWLPFNRLLKTNCKSALWDVWWGTDFHIRATGWCVGGYRGRKPDRGEDSTSYLDQFPNCLHWPLPCFLKDCAACQLCPFVTLKPKALWNSRWPPSREH